MSSTEASEKAPALRLGGIVIGVLAVLTFVEYLIAIWEGPKLVPIMAIAVLKAVAIVVYFMHIGQLRRKHREEAA